MLAEDRKWRGWLDIHQQCGRSPGNWLIFWHSSSVTIAWTQMVEAVRNMQKQTLTYDVIGNDVLQALLMQSMWITDIVFCWVKIIIVSCKAHYKREEVVMWFSMWFTVVFCICIALCFVVFLFFLCHYWNLIFILLVTASCDGRLPTLAAIRCISWHINCIVMWVTWSINSVSLSLGTDLRWRWFLD